MILKLTGIELPDDADCLWKYMSFEKFVSLLGTKSLYFTRADKFEDPLEGLLLHQLRNTINTQSVILLL